MGNCLKTKLKGIVNNDDLRKYGEIVVQIPTPSWGSTAPSTIKIAAPEGKELVLTILGDGTTQFGNVNTTSGTAVKSDDEKQMTITGTITYSFKNYDSNYVYVSIIEKYSISNLQETTNLDLNELKYCQNLEVFSGRGIIGDISEFVSQHSKLKAFMAINVTVNPNKITGRFTDFAVLKDMYYFTIQNCPNMEMSSIEDYVATQREIGNTTSQTNGVTINPDNAPITFQGQQIADGSSVKLYWTATTITYDGTTITA